MKNYLSTLEDILDKIKNSERVIISEVEYEFICKEGTYFVTREVLLYFLETSEIIKDYFKSKIISYV